MIKINLSTTQRQKIEAYHYNAIYNGLGKKKSLEKLLKSIFCSKYSLKDFLIGDKNMLENILSDFNKLSIPNQDKFKKDFETYFINQYETKLAVTINSKTYYEYKGIKYNAYTLCELLNINVCPYCNKNYTITVSDSSRKIYTRPTLDHFLDKATYPFFALSLYNLIPSCHICNSHIKGSTPFTFNTHLNPYFDDFNSIKKFNIDKKLLSLVQKTDKFDIVLEDRKGALSSDIKKADKYIQDLGLDVLYNGHKDKVLELVDISRAYNNDSFENLVNEFSGTTKIFKDTNEVKRLLIGNHIENENIDKRPLNKLIKDISEELNLI